MNCGGYDSGKRKQAEFPVQKQVLSGDTSAAFRLSEEKNNVIFTQKSWTDHKILEVCRPGCLFNMSFLEQPLYKNFKGFIEALSQLFSPPLHIHTSF